MHSTNTGNSVPDSHGCLTFSPGSGAIGPNPCGFPLRSPGKRPPYPTVPGISPGPPSTLPSRAELTPLSCASRSTEGPSGERPGWVTDTWPSPAATGICVHTNSLAWQLGLGNLKRLQKPASFFTTQICCLCPEYCSPGPEYKGTGGLT